MDRKCLVEVAEVVVLVLLLVKRAPAKANKHV